MDHKCPAAFNCWCINPIHFVDISIINYSQFSVVLLAWRALSGVATAGLPGFSSFLSPCQLHGLLSLKGTSLQIKELGTEQQRRLQRASSALCSNTTWMLDVTKICTQRWQRTSGRETAPGMTDASPGPKRHWTRRCDQLPCVER